MGVLSPYCSSMVTDSIRISSWGLLISPLRDRPTGTEASFYTTSMPSTTMPNWL